MINIGGLAGAEGQASGWGHVLTEGVGQGSGQPWLGGWARVLKQAPPLTSRLYR